MQESSRLMMKLGVCLIVWVCVVCEIDSLSRKVESTEDSGPSPLEAMYLGNLRGGQHELDVNDPDVIMAAQFIAAQFAKDPKAPTNHLEVQKIVKALRHSLTQDIVQYIVHMDVVDDSTGVYRITGTASEEFGRGYSLINCAINPL
eukprot:c2161_g1_i2.p1 GENE.c2161_g1_i2~~c2161_g1_i2.p1  ORF type:complete len:146 (+),score=30.19 c2161_g1_i2:511-948(+)